MEEGRYKMLNFQMSNLDTKFINEKIQQVFNKLDSSAKIKIALDLFFAMSEEGDIGITTHMKATLCVEKTYLQCTKADSIKIHGKFENFDVVERSRTSKTK